MKCNIFFVYLIISFYSGSQSGALTAVQIRELLQLISDEKEARESLQVNLKILKLIF